MRQRSVLHVSLLTCIALLAFAGNSVLCRLALGGNAVDAGSFTVIRLLSGSITLLAILLCVEARTRHRTVRPSLPTSLRAAGSWFSALMLFLYALCFSYAYLSLDTGTGALILFGAVQITMILLSLLSGQRLQSFEWLGMLVAFAGFVYLVLPGVQTPSLSGFLLMTLTGIAWGVYTLKGRGASSPLRTTAANFLRTVPLVLLLLVLVVWDATLSTPGVLLAIASGALASGAGYAVWYMALRDLSATQAAVVQLLVPVIAAAGGVVFADEALSARLVVSAALVLGGILLVVMGRYFRPAVARR